MFTLPKFRRVRIPNIPKFWIIATFSNYKRDFIRFIGNAGIGKNPLNKQHYLVLSERKIIWLTLTQWPSAWGIKRVETRFHPWIQNTGDSFYFARIVCPSVSSIDLNCDTAMVFFLAGSRHSCTWILMTILWILTDSKHDPTVLTDSTQIDATFVSHLIEFGRWNICRKIPCDFRKYTIITILLFPLPMNPNIYATKPCFFICRSLLESSASNISSEYRLVSFQSVSSVPGHIRKQ